MRSDVPRPVAGRDLAIAAIVGAAACVAYLPALWTGFTADDFFILARLKQLGGLDHPLGYFGALEFFEYYRPLTFLSHALDWQIWRTDPAGFHLTNVLLHAVNAVLVFVIGRRLDGSVTGLAAGLLFALHPASHEAVYWISARFDLLATCLTLAAFVLVCGPPRGYLFGLLVFGLALLAKESALALPVMVVAYDVIIRRLGWRQAAGRLVPLFLVAAAYAVLRSQVGALEAAGGAARLPKLLILATLVAGVLLAARRPAAWAVTKLQERRVAAACLSGLAVVAILLALPASSDWLGEKIGFASFSVFYLVSPVTVPSPPPNLFDRPSVSIAAIELAVLAALVVLAWRSRQWIASRPPAIFLLICTAAALAPVSSMTSGPRYLYLASAAVSLLGGLVFRSVPRAFQSQARAALALVLILAVVQLMAAGRSWKWASDMTSDALTMIQSALVPCGTQDVVVLTTPVGIRGVFSNLNEVAFDVAGCKPASWTPLLRVVRTDAHVDVTRHGDVIELRVPEYAGNFVASHDLRHFDAPLTGDESVRIDTPIGRLESMPEGNVRVFRLTLADRVRAAHFYFYSDGRVHPLAPR
jgi:NADH:ubiquinone oxidoreductase subunit K